MHFHTDSSNLFFPFFELQQQARGELPQFRRNRRVIGQNNKDSRFQVCNPARASERRRGGFKQELLQVPQALRLAGKRLEVT